MISKDYTVILMYPDYTDAGEWPHDYFTTWVTKPSREEAIENARKQAKQSYEKETENGIEDPSDSAVIGVIEGHHKVYGE